jgi:hypothetical protein
VVIPKPIREHLKSETDEGKALLPAGHMKNSTVIHLDESLAVAAADVPDVTYLPETE